MTNTNQGEMATPQMPEVRSVPVWAPDAEILISGIEWESMQNGIAQLQSLFQASHSVMTRNILNGTIKMTFEKLNPTTMEYEKMEEKEEQKYQEEFKKAVEQVKATQNALTQPTTEDKPLAKEVPVKKLSPKKDS